MNGTRKALPTRRNVAADPHESLREAVTVSRFWRNVDIRADEECWPWQGDRRGDGYGVFYYAGRMQGAHELALSFSTGEKRHPSLMTCHSCDNPPCCNPRHLRFDTPAANVADMYQRGREVNPCKITDERVRLIRERRALGARQLDLAEQFGVDQNYISMLVRGLRRPRAGGPIQTERKYHRG